MFSKENDKNLRISQMHHKRKDNLNGKIKIFGKMLNIILTILVIGPGIITLSSGSEGAIKDDIQLQEEVYYPTEKVIYPNQQLVLLDVTYDHTTATKAFSFFSLPSGMPSNLVSPINYAHGTLYQRVQVITKPSGKTVKYQFCVFQDKIVKEKHACTNEGLLTFTNPSTYFANQQMTSLFQYGNLDWSRKLLTQMLVVKDRNGKPIDDRYGWAGTWDGSPNFALYYPMKVRYTAIIVPPGGGAPIWPSGGNSNSITVISPNGGENLVRGTTKTISWSSTGSPGANVKIELLKGGTPYSTINSYTPNDGSYSWTIPSTQTLGTDYKIKITSTTNSAYTDTSNNNFAISSETSIPTNLAPNPGFEIDLKGDLNPDNWYTNIWGGSAAKIAFAWTTDYKYAGSRSAKITSTDSYGKARWMTGRDIPVIPGQNYNFGGYVKTSSVSKSYICVTFWNSALGYVSSKCTGSKSGTNSWSLLQGNIVAPTGAVYARLELREEGTGTVWFDDVILKNI